MKCKLFTSLKVFLSKRQKCRARRPLQPLLTNHCHTVPYWTHTECFHLSWVSWESCWAALLSLLNVLKLVWFSGVTGRQTDQSLEFWDPPRHTHDGWIVTLFWTSDGHTEINWARWRAPLAQCVEAGSVRLWRQSDHVAAWWTRGFDCTVISLWSESCEITTTSPDWSAAASCEQLRLSFHLSVNLWGNVQQIWP